MLRSVDVVKSNCLPRDQSLPPFSSTANTGIPWRMMEMQHTVRYSCLELGGRIEYSSNIMIRFVLNLSDD